MNKKGQVATEYMLLIGVLLVIVALLSAYSFFVYNETIASKHLNNSMKNLKQGVNNVYYLGNGNSMVVEIIFPNGASDISLSGSAIIVTKETYSVVSTDTIVTDAILFGTLPISIGSHDILIENINGDVNLSEI